MRKKVKKSKDTYSYKGWLTSDNFNKRMFAVVGYSMLGSFVVSAIIWGVVFILTVIIAIFGSL